MLKSVSHLTDWMDTHQQMWWVFLRLHQFHFPLGPFFKRPHLPPRNTLITGGKLRAVYFWISWRGEGPLFPAGYCPPFLASQTKPGCDLGTGKKKKRTKSKTSVVSPGKWASATPTLGPPPRPVPRGRGTTPAGRSSSAKLFSVLGPPLKPNPTRAPWGKVPGVEGTWERDQGF